MSDLSRDEKRAVSIKIKALLAKTTEAGCTEAEAMAAAHKAHELLAKYQLSLSELDLREEGTEEVKIADDEIVRALAQAVAAYCEVKVWRDTRDMRFLGLASDAFFAEWLMLALTSFVKRKGLDFSLKQSGIFQQDIMDFRAGCANRIKDRLMAEVAERKRAAPTGTSLMVVKGHLITEAWAKKNIKLTSDRIRWAQPTSATRAYAEGQKAGDSARFARPVGRDEFETRRLK